MVSVRNLTHGALTIRDGSGTPYTLVIPVEEGNVEWTVIQSANTFYNRGTIAGFTEGIPEPLQVSFGIKFEHWAEGDFAGARPTVVDALTGRGMASTTDSPVNGEPWVSTLTSGPYCVDLIFALNDPANGTADATGVETITFEDFHADEIRFAEGEEYSTVQVSGKCPATYPSSVVATPVLT